MTVSNASKQIEVGERGVYHAINVIQNGPQEELSNCDVVMPGFRVQAKFAIGALN